MKVVFVSNYFNHHQESLALELYKQLNGEFWFISTERMSKERKELGYADMENRYPFIIAAYDNVENEAKAKQLVMDCDVLIYGSAPKEFYYQRIQNKKLTFLYTERLLKQKPKGIIFLRKWIGMQRFYARLKRYPFYVLCASAYTSGDINQYVKRFENTYRWGYFTKVIKYDIESLMELKREKQGVLILWVGRFLKWKHPESAVFVAEYLKKLQVEFELRMVGGGELEEDLRVIISEKKLENYVHLMGTMSPENVRKQMEQADIFLFTSDFNEGWGAVLNESMNSACAVVASHAIGSVPFLIHNNENGIIYKSGCQQELNEAVYMLVKNISKREAIGRAAYDTIINEWNAEVAARRFIELAGNYFEKGDMNCYLNGPCSKAENIQNDWLEKERNG